MGEKVSMSLKEVDRVRVLEKLLHKVLTQKEAATQLGLSTRQIRRLQGQYAKSGAEGLISKKRGARGNRCLAEDVKKTAIKLIITCYQDFGPTLACQKLNEVHKLIISPSTVRALMIAHFIWIPRRAKKPIIHQLRERRSCLGALIQFDASIEAWFENRGPKCAALVFVDDATSRLMLLRFVSAENLWNYFSAIKEYVQRHGRPRQVYCDFHSALRKRKASLLQDKGMTQFQRAMAALDIELIHAHSPEAKGRVERANRTLQDRCIKEMRLRGISSLESANVFADEFVEDYNKRFAKVPKSSYDTHRSIEDGIDLDKIFSWHEERVVTKNLMVQYDNKFYLIVSKDGYSKQLKGAKVTIIESPTGVVRIFYKDQELYYRLYEELPYEEGEHYKELHLQAAARWLKPDKKIGHPSHTHAWRHFKI